MASIEPTENTLRDYWRVVRRRKWIVAICVVAAVAPAVALALQQTPMYSASAAMLIQDQSSGSLFGSNSNSYYFYDVERNIENESVVVQGPAVAERARQNLGLDWLPAGASASSDGVTDIISVSVDSPDPQTAAILANAYVQAYIEVKSEQKFEAITKAIGQLQAKAAELQTQIDALDDQMDNSSTDDDTSLEQESRALVVQQASYEQMLDEIRIDSALTTPAAEVIYPAVAPSEPFEPTPERSGALALVVGLLLGLGIAFFVDYIDQSIKSPEDLAGLGTDLPLLAVVPLLHKAPGDDKRPIVISRPNDSASEAYRGLRTNVQFLGLEHNVKVMQITSAMPGEGKTTTALNLAGVLAQTGASVVLVDADLRRPRIHEVFSIDGNVGLTDNLSGELIDMTANIVAPDLTVIASGRVPPNPSEILSSQRMAAIIDDLRARYDHVVVDSAPVLPVSDAVALSRQVDAVLLVVQAGRTTVPEVHHALASLDQVHASVLGIVLNKVTKRSGTDGYGYGYAYGYSTPEPKQKKQPKPPKRSKQK